MPGSVIPRQYEGDSSRWRHALCSDSPGLASAQNDTGALVLPVFAGLIFIYTILGRLGRFSHENITPMCPEKQTAPPSHAGGQGDGKY